MDYPSLQPFPPQIATLVGEIESVIGKPIEIRTRDATYNPLMAPEELAMCDCHMINGSMNVSIFLPNEKSTPMHTLFHELLHAHRNVCLSIPRLTPIKDSAAGFRLTSSIDNDVEHLFIIPQEINFSEESLDYWYPYYDAKLMELASKVIDNELSALALRNDLLRLWVVTSLCLPQWSGASQASTVLRQSGYLDEANKLLNKIQLDFPSKERCLATFFRFSKLPAEMFCMSRFLVRERRIEQLPIPLPQ